MPATRYPGTRAGRPAPASVTRTIIPVICEAAVGLTTCRTSLGSTFSTVPSVCWTWSTMCGCISLPWLANEFTAVISWIGVTEMPWPNAIVAKLTSFRSLNAGNDGLISPASSVPVGVPNP